VEDFTELVADAGVAAGYDEDFAGLWGEVGFGESRGGGGVVVTSRFGGRP